MTQILGQWSLQPELSEARRVREEVTKVLQPHAASLVEPFQLACAELVVNLSRYPQPKPEEVVLTLSQDDYSLWLELKDNGPSFNHFSQFVAESDVLEAAESGMGLKLLANYFDDISYIPACYRDDACNLMLLRLDMDNLKPQTKVVLIVDDDPTQRIILSTYLKQNYKIHSADSVETAFPMVLRYKPDLIICDIRMPNADGPALFDKISHIPEVAETAFIYMTGCLDKEIVQQAMSRPIDDLLEKPIQRDILEKCIERIMLRREHLSLHVRQEIEQKVTLGLKPNLPTQVAGFSIELRSLNPEAGGGDLVQLYEQGGKNRIIFADLMGHGLSAKGYAFALAGYIRGLCAGMMAQQIELEALIKQLAHGFENDPLLNETVATLIAVELLDEGVINLVNAGQPRPVLIGGNGVHSLEVTGALPGLGIDDYQQNTLSLQSGERLLVFSDGLVDAAEELPVELENLLWDSREQPLNVIADQILQFRLKSTGLDDDLTFFLIEPIKVPD